MYKHCHCCCLLHRSDCPTSHLQLLDSTCFNHVMWRASVVSPFETSCMNLKYVSVSKHSSVSNCGQNKMLSTCYLSHFLASCHGIISTSSASSLCRSNSLICHWSILRSMLWLHLCILVPYGICLPGTPTSAWYSNQFQVIPRHVRTKSVLARPLDAEAFQGRSVWNRDIWG
jgi:hypothetical protein